MRKLLLAMLCLGLLVLPAQARSPGPPRDEPVELMRTLQHVQVRIAQGSEAALHLKAKLLRHMAREYSRYPMAVWTTPRNAAAAVSFVLSGGHPDAVRHLVSGEVLAEPFGSLLKGALAYSRGQAGEAEAVFSKFDAFSLPASLAGHVAMIKAVLLAPRDSKAAMALLDRARLLLPATLVEETALRRGMMLAAGEGDRARFMMQSGTYLRRFGRSVYEPDFAKKFAVEAVKLDIGADPDLLEEVGRLSEALVPDRRVMFYLALARSGIEHGANVIVEDAAGRARALAPIKSNEWVRANAYGAIVGVVTDERRSAVRRLQNTDLAKLDGRDTDLVKAALKLADEVERLPDLGKAVAMRTSDTPMPDVLAQAERVLRDVDELVGARIQ